MAVLKSHGSEYGYCENCERPAVVVLLELVGWKHVFRVCEICLGKLAQQGREVVTR